MASDTERKRSRGGEEAAAKKAKRARLDEERTSSERELALHPSDEDIFPLALFTGRGTCNYERVCNRCVCMYILARKGVCVAVVF